MNRQMKRQCISHKHNKRHRCSNDSDDSDDEKDVNIYVDGNAIYFHNEVSIKSVTKLLQCLHALSKKVLYASNEFKFTPVIDLYIHSEGGDLFAGLSAYDHIRRNTVQVNTIVDGMVASAASIILLAGVERKMLANASVLIHQLTTGFVGKFQDLQDENKHCEYLMKKMKELYLAHTRLKSKQLESIINREFYLTSEECLKNGLVHEIL